MFKRGGDVIPKKVVRRVVEETREINIEIPVCSRLCNIIKFYIEDFMEP